MLRIIVLISILIMMLPGAANAADPVLCVDTPCIAVESAFSSELAKLLEKATEKTDYVYLGRTFTTGKLAGNNCVFFLSGVSMVNAAQFTQLALDKFNITHLVFSGIAGGVNPNLNIGDVTVPAKWSEYQEMRYSREEADGTFKCSSDLQAFGMQCPSSPCVTKKSGEPDKCERMRWFTVDATMLAIAHNISPTITLARCGTDRDGNEVCLDVQPKLVTRGNGVAGPTFVDNAAFRQWTWEQFAADSLDMESSAVAHVCYINEVPFLIFRSLSDLAGGSDQANQIGTFFLLASSNSALTLTKFLKAWAARPQTYFPSVWSGLEAY